MKKPLAVRDSIAVHLLQAIICKREDIRPSPKEAAQLAVEHTDCLINELDKKKRKKISYLEDWSKKKVLQ